MRIDEVDTGATIADALPLPQREPTPPGSTTARPYAPPQPKLVTRHRYKTPKDGTLPGWLPLQIMEISHGCPIGATKATLQHLCQWMDEQKCYWQSGRQRLTVAASVFTEKH